MWPFTKKKKESNTSYIRLIGKSKVEKVIQITREFFYIKNIGEEEYRTWEYFGPNNQENNHFRLVGPYRLQSHGSDPYRIYKNDILVFYGEEDVSDEDWMSEFIQLFVDDMNQWNERREIHLEEQKSAVRVRPANIRNILNDIDIPNQITPVYVDDIKEEVKYIQKTNTSGGLSTIRDINLE